MNMDPAAQLKEISDQLQQKFDEAGMGKVEEFTDKMEELMKTVTDGPDKVLDGVQEQFKAMTGSIENALKDPQSLAPSGGGLAACGAWYGSAVAGKLMVFKDEIDEMVKSMTDLAGNVKTPVTKLAESVKGAIEDLEKGIAGLAKLPKLVTSELEGKTTPEDIGKINTGAMKKALEVGDIAKPIEKIMSCKEVLQGAIQAMSAGAGTLEDFLSSAPGKVRTAFDVPQPLCFLTSMVMDAAPQAMKDLLAFVEKLEKFSLDPIMKAFNGAADTVSKIDVEAMKAPVEKFTKDAKELVDKLDHVVKMAGGGAVGGMLGGLKKMF